MIGCTSRALPLTSITVTKPSTPKPMPAAMSNVSGTGDFATAPIIGPGSQNPATLNLQTTRTLDGPGKATLSCKAAPDAHWQGGNASIIALKVGSSTRTEAGR